jgi:hypothetical protein
LGPGSGGGKNKDPGETSRIRNTACRFLLLADFIESSSNIVVFMCSG